MSLSSLSELLAGRGVQRVCHFTPSRNLAHIFADGYLRATRDLRDDVRSVYNPTDLARYDGHRELICCCIEYPNPFYFAVARRENPQRLFSDWVVLLLKPELLDRDGVLFCTGNAARGRGGGARPGPDGLADLFADSVVGSGRTYERRSTHLPSCPTDLQAEVLVPGPIPVKAISGIVVISADQAATEAVRLRQLAAAGTPSQPVNTLRWVVAPMFFEKYSLTDAIHAGRRPLETEWAPEVTS